MAGNKRLTGYSGFTPVGRGGFSVVYRAVQDSLGRDVAIKFLNVDLSDDSSARRFTSECRAIGRIGAHPHVVDVYDAGVSADGEPFIVMKYYPAGTFGELVVSHGALPVDKVVDVGIKLADALQFAHDHGIIHRDIKPENILRATDDDPVLTDFGVAAMPDAVGNYTTSVAFSRAHAAPEVLDRNAFGVASDIYSLGSTLFMLLDGRPAFDAETEARQIVQVMTAPLPPLRRQDVPAPIKDVIFRAMQRNPADRFVTAADLRSALQSVGVASARSEPAGSRSRRRTKASTKAVAAARDQDLSADERTRLHKGAGTKPSGGMAGQGHAKAIKPGIGSPDRQAAEEAATVLRPAVTAAGSEAAGQLTLKEVPGSDRRAERSKRRRWAWALPLVAGFLVFAGAVTYAWAQSQYYVGNEGGYVAIYRGPPGELGPLSLRSVEQVTTLAVDSLPDFEAAQVEATIGAESLASAQQLVQRLTERAAECTTAPTTPGCPSTGGTDSGLTGATGAGTTAAPGRSGSP